MAGLNKFRNFSACAAARSSSSRSPNTQEQQVAEHDWLIRVCRCVLLAMAVPLQSAPAATLHAQSSQPQPRARGFEFGPAGPPDPDRSGRARIRKLGS